MIKIDENGIQMCGTDAELLTEATIILTAIHDQFTNLYDEKKANEALAEICRLAVAKELL